MIDNGDVCPFCGARQMPKWTSITQIGRACQGCKKVESRPVIIIKDGKIQK